MSPTKEVDYEQRAHRMINRWAGVQSAPRSNADRKAGSEIFTERSAQEQDIPGQSEYVVGKILKIINSNLYALVRLISIYGSGFKVLIFFRGTKACACFS